MAVERRRKPKPPPKQAAQRRKKVAKAKKSGTNLAVGGDPRRAKAPRAQQRPLAKGRKKGGGSW